MEEERKALGLLVSGLVQEVVKASSVEEGRLDLVVELKLQASHLHNPVKEDSGVAHKAKLQCSVSKLNQAWDR